MQPVLALLVVLLLSISPDMVRADCQNPPTFESASIASVKYKCNSNPFVESIQATCMNGRWHFAGVNPLSCNCHASTKAGTKGFEGPSTEARLENCTTFCQDAGDVILVPVGDVDGDGYQDLVCHKSTGLIHVALNTKQGGFTCKSNPAGGIPQGWCRGQKQQVFVGDFDGDRRADLLCHSYQDRSKDVRLRDAIGNSYSDPTSEGAFTGWCYNQHAELHVADFDGDGKADLLCHDNSTGYKWLAKGLLPQNGFVRKQQIAMGWCAHASAILYVADSDGDASSDIFCHDDQGTSWITKSRKCTNLAACNTQFLTKGQAQGRRGFCPGNTVAHMRRYHLIDFNGDGKADQYCHKTGSGQNNCVLTYGQGGFSAGQPCAWHSDDDYCNQMGDLLIFGRFFGTNRDDLLCIRGRTYLLRRNYGL